MISRLQSFWPVCLGLVLVLSLSGLAFAATTGKIAGRVVDKSTGEPLAAANVVILRTTMGAMADAEGRYFIINVPPGLYAVQASVIGYEPVTMTDVRVNVDVTTPLDFELEPTVLEVVEGITVVAERPIVDKTLTATRTIVDAEEITALPVDNVVQAMTTTAGVFGRYIRGGAANQSAYVLDGANITEERGGASEQFTINPFMIQELEVKRGTFNAEFGSATAGITTIVSRSGGRQFSGNIEWRRTTGGLEHFSAPKYNWYQDNLDLGGDKETLDRQKKDILDFVEQQQAAGVDVNFPSSGVIDRSNLYWDYNTINPDASGTPGIKGWSYTTGSNSQQFGSYFPGKYRNYYFDGKTDKPTNRVDFGFGGPLGNKVSWFVSGRFNETWGRWPGQYNRLFNGSAKLTFRPTTNTKVSVFGLLEDNGFFSGKPIESWNYNWKFNLEGLNKVFLGSYLWNVVWSHTLTPETYYEVRLNQKMRFRDEYNPSWGKQINPRENLERDAVDYIVSGATARAKDGTHWSEDRYSTTTLEATVTSQITFNHQIKAGLSGAFHYNKRKRVSDAALGFGGDDYTVYPVDYAAYIQDRMEYGSLVVNAGVRLDVFNPNANAYNPFRPAWPGSLQPDNQGTNGANYRPIPTSMKVAVSPRVGISHPITDKAAIHYSYGIFRKRQTLNFLFVGFGNGGAPYPTYGNPDLPFETAAAYEMGVQMEVYPDWFLDLTGYLRDTKNMPVGWRAVALPGYDAGINQPSTYLGTNSQDARGLEVSLRKRMSHRWSFRGAYTMSFANNQISRLTDAGQANAIGTETDYFSGPRFEWAINRTAGQDRRHLIVGNLLLDLPLDVDVAVTTRANSGLELTTKDDQGLDPFKLRGNRSRSPWVATTDVIITKSVQLGGAALQVFTDIRNIFNKKNINSVGSGDWWSDHHRDPTGSVFGNPSAYGTPRDVWLGVALNW